MATKTKTRRPAPSRAAESPTKAAATAARKGKAPVPTLANSVPLSESWATPPATLEERLSRIQTLGERVEEYIKFMCDVENLMGSSQEAKQKAVAAFYERLYTLEQELALIQENLRLG